LFSFKGEFEHEVLRETAQVAAHLALELFGLHAVERSEVAVQQYTLASDGVDTTGNGSIGRGRG